MRITADRRAIECRARERVGQILQTGERDKQRKQGVVSTHGQDFHWSINCDHLSIIRDGAQLVSSDRDPPQPQLQTISKPLQHRPAGEVRHGSRTHGGWGLRGERQRFTASPAGDGMDLIGTLCANLSIGGNSQVLEPGQRVEREQMVSKGDLYV